MSDGYPVGSPASDSRISPGGPVQRKEPDAERASIAPSVTSLAFVTQTLGLGEHDVMSHDLDRRGDRERQESSRKPGQAATDEGAHDHRGRGEIDRVLVDPWRQQVVLE